MEQSCINKIKKFVDEHLKQEFSLIELADCAGYSAFHFAREFKSAIGLSTMEYVREQRVHAAAKDIADGKNICDTAMDYCFDTHAGFTKAFTSIYNYTPKNYFKYTKDEINWIDSEQMSWLGEQMEDSPWPCVLMSHTPLLDPYCEVSNAGDIRSLIKKVNQDKKKVILSMAGHLHLDGLRVYEGVPYWHVNSISAEYVGKEFSTVRYSQTIHKMYPKIHLLAPYWDALFAVVTINAEGIHIKGRETNFVGPSPQALGFDTHSWPSSPIIASRLLTYNMV